MTYKQFLLAFFSLFFMSFVSVLCSNDIDRFAKSFVEGYCFNPESRFAREYHPYLLDKTQDSVKKLEQHIGGSGFNIKNRLLIMGYEPNAAPAYFDCLSHATIDDEGAVKTTGGFEFAPGNLFGFLTGYLFKDTGKSSLVEHISAEPIELFDDTVSIVQRHTFGKWHDFIVSYQNGIQPHIIANNAPALFKYLTNFWQSIYESECKNVQGSSFATQDILFSLYYVKHLAQSAVPIKKLFVGPDLSYPIEVVLRQSSEVTKNAQVFVQRFVKELQPIDNKKTAYIFLSFVDGVGKSTLLGNVCNWLEHSNQFDKYTHVSNASSQRATLYSVNEQVVIVDLPAQISHYCAKPDGAVYIDLGFCRDIDEAALMAIYMHIMQQAESLKNSNEQRKIELAAGAQPQSPEDQVLAASNTLEIKSDWCPFELAGKHYVFNINNPTLVRMMVPFDQAHSQGLKIKEPELMIFDKGLNIPMRYGDFLNDLTNQMHAAGVENVVLVDFLSMYPRTSRETIRINYLLQQLKTFYHDEYDIQSSVYRTFSHHHQLYPLFFKQRDQFERTVFLETLLRWVIYDTIKQASVDDIRSLDAQAVRERLQERIKLLYKDDKKTLNTIINQVRTRIDQEAPHIEHCQYSSWYEAVSHFSVDRFVQLAEMVRSIIATYHPDQSVCSLFNDCAADIVSVADQGRSVVLANDIKLDLVARLHDHDVDRPLIELLVKQVRSVWYNQLVSLMVPELHPSCKQVFVVKKCPDGFYYLLRHIHKEYSANQPRLLHEVQLFGLPFEDDDSELSLMESVMNEIQSDEYYKKHTEELSNMFVATSRVCAFIDERNLWQRLLAEHRDMRAPELINIPYETIRLVVQALATMHFNFKDPKDQIMVRYGNQEDFVAALRLFEQLILPKYLSITTKGQLFDDHYQVAPLVGQFDKKD